MDPSTETGRSDTSDDKMLCYGQGKGKGPYEEEEQEIEPTISGKHFPYDLHQLILSHVSLPSTT
jgi:hypothetical protein